MPYTGDVRKPDLRHLRVEYRRNDFEEELAVDLGRWNDRTQRPDVCSGVECAEGQSVRQAGAELFALVVRVEARTLPSE